MGVKTVYGLYFCNKIKRQESHKKQVHSGRDRKDKRLKNDFIMWNVNYGRQN